jgi:hypothetical protein
MSWKLAVGSARCVRARQCIGKSCHALSSLKIARGTLLWLKTNAISVAGRRWTARATFSSKVLGEFELCFHYDLLYKTLQELAGGHHWHNKWMRQMQAYRRCGMSVTQICALSSVYSHFREACIDFVELMDIDYRALLSCKCENQHQHLVAHGISVSCPLRKLHLLGPWLPQDEGLLPQQQHGSEYHHRHAVQDAELRRWLRAFASASGLDAASFGSMIGCCDRLQWPEMADLLRALSEEQDERTVAFKWARKLLCELGANSPAWAIVPDLHLPLLREWLQVTQAMLTAPLHQRRVVMATWSHAQDDVVRCGLPKLWEAMREIHRVSAAQEDPPNLLTLVDLMVRLKQVCLVSSTLPLCMRAQQL